MHPAATLKFFIILSKSHIFILPWAMFHCSRTRYSPHHPFCTPTSYFYIAVCVIVLRPLFGLWWSWSWKISLCHGFQNACRFLSLASNCLGNPPKASRGRQRIMWHKHTFSQGREAVGTREGVLSCKCQSNNPLRDDKNHPSWARISIPVIKISFHIYPPLVSHVCMYICVC